MFQASLFKMSFTKINLIYFVISTLSTQTLIRSQIDLGFYCFYLEIIWKIHGIFWHRRGGKPASVLTHFEILITKICMKVPGICTKKLEKTWNLGPKTLRKPGIWYLKKSANPVKAALPAVGVVSQDGFCMLSGRFLACCQEVFWHAVMSWVVFLYT